MYEESPWYFSMFLDLLCNIPIINVFNKVDLMIEPQDLWTKNDEGESRLVYISAKSGKGLSQLKKKLRSVLTKDLELFYLRIPQELKDL